MGDGAGWDIWRIDHEDIPGLVRRSQCDGECGNHGPRVTRPSASSKPVNGGCRRWPTILGIVYLNGDEQDLRPENLKVVCGHCRVGALVRRDKGEGGEDAAIPQ